MSKVQHQLLSEKNNDGLLIIQAEEKLSKAALKEYILSNKEELQRLLVKHGALLFRNFDIQSAQDFEDIAHEIDDELKNNYLGTSPRNSINKYTFSASELPHFYPIPQHCEMSFLKFPPRKLFFYCHVAPVIHGETPICDFRKVYAQLDEEVRNAFQNKGVKTIRNYDGPNAKAKFDLWKLKRWDEVFNTTDKSKVEATCKEYDIAFEWLPNDKLRLYNEQEAFIKHPVTGEGVWFNHTQVFHRDAAAYEYKHIANRHKNLSATFFSALTSFLTFIKKHTVATTELGTHTVFKDGSEIPTEYVAHLEQTIWNNMQFSPWQKGDVMAIDNFSTSHGRMPYKGAREIYVCWAANH
jgi:alpha-ketoglutarate-dependent taurine dioxygenase